MVNGSLDGPCFKYSKITIMGKVYVDVNSSTLGSSKLPCGGSYLELVWSIVVFFEEEGYIWIIMYENILPSQVEKGCGVVEQVLFKIDLLDAN